MLLEHADHCSVAANFQARSGAVGSRTPGITLPDRGSPASRKRLLAVTTALLTFITGDKSFSLLKSKAAVSTANVQGSTIARRARTSNSQANMVKSTQIARIDGLLLAATVDDEQAETELAEPKANAKMIIRRLNRNSEPQASIEAGKYTLQYVWVPSSLKWRDYC